MQLRSLASLAPFSIVADVAIVLVPPSAQTLRERDTAPSPRL